MITPKDMADAVNAEREAWAAVESFVATLTTEQQTEFYRLTNQHQQAVINRMRMMASGVSRGV